MADKCHMCLLGLIILCPLFTGSSGVNDTVFCNSGENVRLPCNNALSDCNSTTWIYKKHSGTVELVAGGEKKNDIERHERLSLGSDCSLNIKKVTKEDYGFYSCRQYVNGQQQGTDACVYLHFLDVSSSSSQTEMRPGSSVTLSCQLYYDGVSCDTLVRTEGIQLIWVNQAGVNLQTDSRYQISFSSTHCNSTLTTTLLNEDHNREWRCQVKQRNELKTSVTYTVNYSAPVDTTTLIPVSSSNSEKKSSQTTAAVPTQQDTQITPTPETTSAPITTQQVSPSVIGIVVAAALAVLLPAVIFWVICKKRADNRRETNDPVEHKDDVTYTEVATYCKIQAKKNKVHDDDKVTYSSIRGATAEPQDDCSQLYASVNKNHHK
ncbi:uncharacterized protein LOC127160132 [Labeo rohita]|uniref:uncharacterized protein LOC127160132 n=1 Tax=Labeo rohita TaxID=84645 RepID=UPI0021E29284|nr:uncharacterized protein LOC127160132 [Labeo rohita]